MRRKLKLGLQVVDIRSPSKVGSVCNVLAERVVIKFRGEPAKHVPVRFIRRAGWKPRPRKPRPPAWSEAEIDLDELERLRKRASIRRRAAACGLTWEQAVEAMGG